MNFLPATQQQPLRWHGWLIGIILLLYSIFSAFDYIMSIVQGADYFVASGMTPSQVEYFLNFPVWATVAWTVSVWGMLLATIAFLLRARITFILFTVSLTGTLLYILYVFVLSEGREAMGVIWPAPLFIAGITAAMIFYSKKSFGINN